MQRLLRKNKTHDNSLHDCGGCFRTIFWLSHFKLCDSKELSLSLSRARARARETDKRDRVGVGESERAAAHIQQSPPRMRRKARAPGYPCCQATRLDLWVQGEVQRKKAGLLNLSHSVPFLIGASGILTVLRPCTQNCFFDCFT